MITLEPNRSFEHLLPGRDRAFFYGLADEVTVAGHAVQAGQIAWSDPVHQDCASAITLATGDGDQPSVVMVYTEVTAGWPRFRLLSCGFLLWCGAVVST